MGNISINNIKVGLIINDPGLSIRDSGVADRKEGLERGNLVKVGLIGIKSGLDEIVKKVLEESSNFSGGGFVSEVLGDFDECLGEVGEWREALELFC